ncbi:MAG TPA: hypothetical protein ENK73_08995 [Thiomicrospira sp.]|nr:hypothetical protein [Thiomicrospira sp.]
MTQTQPFKKSIEDLSIGFLCGFEIEFFLNPNKLQDFQKDMAEILPDYQMLLIYLNEVPKTNHRHFYLIKEVTGLPPEGMQSYEIVSPILDYKSLPYFINAIFILLNEYGAKDNDSIGFHLHVSTQASPKLSPISLLFFLDQEGVLNSKERQYTRDIIKQFFDYSALDWQWIFEEVTRKCYNVNFLHYDQDNHIELRSMGGLGYLNKQNDILTNCFKCLLAYEKALNTPVKSISQGILENYSLKQHVLQTKRVSYQTLKESDQNHIWFV